MECSVVSEAYLPYNLQESLVDTQPSTIVGGEHQSARQGHNHMVGVHWWHVSVAQDYRVPQKPTTCQTECTINMDHGSG